MGVKLSIALLIVLVKGIFCQGKIFEIVLEFYLKIKLTSFSRKQLKRKKSFKKKTNSTVHNFKRADA